MNEKTGAHQNSNSGEPGMEMILYRFFPAEFGLRTLETGLMRVGRFQDFNDPFEFMPQSTELSGNASLNCDFHRQSFIEATGSRYGIICFSEEGTVIINPAKKY